MHIPIYITMNCNSSCPLEKKRLCNIRTPLRHQDKEVIYNIFSYFFTVKMLFIFVHFFPQERGWIKPFGVRPTPLKVSDNSSARIHIRNLVQNSQSPRQYSANLRLKLNSVYCLFLHLHVAFLNVKRCIFHDI